MVVGMPSQGKMLPKGMGASGQRGIMDIAEAKCKKCGFVAYGSSAEEVNRTACLLCGEIIGGNQEIFPEKEASLGEATAQTPITGDDPKITSNKKSNVTAMKTIKSLFTVEFYKCAVLTIIAVTLIGIFLKMPTPFTLRNVQNKTVEPKDIPLVRVKGGDIDVNVNDTVDVNVTNTVEVEGDVRVSR